VSFELRTVTFSGDTPGQVTTLSYYEIGPADASTKIYLQAALHADEHPGTMLLHHLLPMLREADTAGQLNARFTVMPLVNPLGAATFSLRRHIGRYDAATGVNFNRRWPDLFKAVGAGLANRLGADAGANVGLVRAAVAEWLASQSPRSANEALRLHVMRLAHDADFVLDLHCDDDSLIHIFISPELMPGLQDLADWMGSAATLTAEDSGGGSFDEVLPQLYRQLARANPGKPVPMATAAATLEYRGQADVFDALGKDDARRLHGFFCERGFIAADTGPRPAAMPAATPFEATEIIRVGSPGLVAYRVELGDVVTKGQPVADLIALDGPDAFIGRTPILAGTDGFVLSRSMNKYAPRGASIMKIVGTTPLVGRQGGYLLED